MIQRCGLSGVVQRGSAVGVVQRGSVVVGIMILEESLYSQFSFIKDRPT